MWLDGTTIKSFYCKTLTDDIVARIGIKYNAYKSRKKCPR